MSENPQQPEEQHENDTVSEQFELKGSELVDRVKELIEEGNVRRFVIRNAENEVLLVVPVTATVVASGAILVLTPFAPVLAGLGALAAFLAKVKLEVVRVDENKTKNEEKKKVDLE